MFLCHGMQDEGIVARRPESISGKGKEGMGIDEKERKGGERGGEGDHMLISSLGLDYHQ